VPITYTILPDRGLVYVRYTGIVDFAETGALFAAYLRDPAYRPGQKQLIDFSAVTGFDSDYTRLMAVQAKKAESFVLPGTETLIVYYAPTPETFRIARFALHSWEDAPGVIVRVLTEPAAIRAFLGLPEGSLAALLEDAGP
jgi:hypothetical protein